MADPPLIAHFSSGIIEISAVATLIGAPIVEAMTLGLKSASCLPWASISSFGLLHVAKAALAAAVPDWTRESLGLQNANADAALGLCLPIAGDKWDQVRSRVDLGDVKAISTSMSVKTGRSQDTGRAPLSVYQLDRASRLVLDTVPPGELGRAILVHEFMVDLGGLFKPWKDWVTLLLSLGKAVEVVGLWVCAADTLLLIFTALPWAYGFVCGLVLVLGQQSRDQYSAAQTDVLAGQLPSPLHQGGYGKLVVGMPRNCRRSRAWRLTWTLYSPVAMVGVVGTFLVLGRNNSKVIYLWIAFQSFWLLMRTAVFYFVEGAAGTRQSLLVGKPWEMASPELKQRTLSLLLTLSRQQASLHPRGAGQYDHDLMDTLAIQQRLGEVGWSISECVEIDDAASLGSVRITDVVGDTVLRSVNWFKGANLDNNEMFDSALVFLRVSGRCIAVPSVRVCICRCKRTESKEWPRGDSHGEVCKGMRWVIWIPVRTLHDGDLTWLEAEGPKTKGNMDIQCLSTDQLDKSLAGGEFWVSFKSVGQLGPVLQVSRTASQILISMVLGVSSASKAVQSEENVLPV